LTERDFCYWLQGFFELNAGAVTLTSQQIESIRNHLNLVFEHSIDTPDPTGRLQAAHDGKKLLTEEYKDEIAKQLDAFKKDITSLSKSVKFLRDPRIRC
jgi:uncharacterized protein YlzI (FlbEa/FlbD family)